MRKNKKRYFKKFLVKKKIFFLFLIGGGSGIFLTLYPFPEKHLLVQGYIEGKFVYLAPAVSGQIEKMLVTEGDPVKKGQKLAILEQQREIAARDGAIAQLTHAKEILKDLLKSKRPEEIQASEAALEKAKTSLHRSKIFLERQKPLLKTQAISQQQYDDAVTNYNVAKSHVDELDAQLRLAKLPSREDKIRAAEADVEANEANLRQQQWVLDQKTIFSPVSGIVYENVYMTGDWASMGTPIVTLLPLDSIKIRFFVPLDTLSKLSLGKKVQIRVDGLTASIDGKITYISPDAQYNPPMIYSRDMRAKFIYLIEAEPLTTEKLTLHPGQPVDVELES